MLERCFICCLRGLKFLVVVVSLSAFARFSHHLPTRQNGLILYRLIGFWMIASDYHFLQSSHLWMSARFGFDVITRPLITRVARLARHPCLRQLRHRHCVTLLASWCFPNVAPPYKTRLLPFLWSMSSTGYENPLNGKINSFLM